MEIELLSFTPKPEKVIEQSARTSYQSFNKTTEDSYKKLIKRLIALGHFSVLEHAIATFKISGVSRVFLAQFSRHRLLSLVVESQRYVNQSNSNYIIPNKIPDKYKKRFKEFIEELNNFYNELIKNKVKKEDARYILPQAITTEMTATANFREWLHIISIRVSLQAQWEIREVVIKIWKLLYEIAPSVFDIETFKTFPVSDYDYKEMVFKKLIGLG